MSSQIDVYEKPSVLTVEFDGAFVLISRNQLMEGEECLLKKKQFDRVAKNYVIVEVLEERKAKGHFIGEPPFVTTCRVQEV
jgi:hypothetical protein